MGIGSWGKGSFPAHSLRRHIILRVSVAYSETCHNGDNNEIEGKYLDKYKSIW